MLSYVNNSSKVLFLTLAGQIIYNRRDSGPRQPKTYVEWPRNILETCCKPIGLDTDGTFRNTR